MRSSNQASAVALVVLLVTGVTAGATTVAAQSDESALGDVFSEDAGPAEYLDATLAGIGGTVDRAGYAIGNYAPGFVQDLIGVEKPDPATEAEAVTAYYNGNNASVESWINDRTNVSGDKTIRVSWHLGGESETRYVLVNASDGNITSSRIVDSTNRTVGETLDVCGYAADRSPAELERFVTTFAEPSKNVTAPYLARMKGRYGSDVETTLISSGGECPAEGS